MRPNWLRAPHARRLVMCACLWALCGCTTPPSPVVRIDSCPAVPAELMQLAPDPVLLEPGVSSPQR